MATAPESEGKIMASAEDLCGLCEDHMAIKHCAVCPVDLCVSCAKGHQKLPATRNHDLSDIIRGGAAPKSAKFTSQTGACPKHEDKIFTILCKDCVVLGCDSCKADHSGHTIQTLNDDPKLCHRVISKHIQHLLDDVHELEDIKALIEGQICTYDDAILKVDRLESDLFKKIREKADRIRKQLKDLKDGKYKQLSDQVNDLMIQLNEIDQSIVQLTALRKSMDFTVLTKELAKSQDMINKLQSYKENLQPHLTPVDVDDVLPNGDKIEDIDDDLDVMFTIKDIHSPSKRLVPNAEWCFTAANGGKDLSTNGKNHVTMTNVTYGPGPRDETQGAVVVPRSGTESMIVMNPDEKLRFSGEITFYMEIFHECKGESGYLFIYDTGVTTFKDFGALVYIGSYDSLCVDIGLSCITPAILKPNNWNKIALVFRPTELTVYVNGAIAHTVNKQLDLTHTHIGHLHFGRRPGFSGFKGRIHCCKFFDVALDANEIKYL